MTETFPRRAVLLGLSGALAAGAVPAAAATYPDSDVTIIVPFAAGGSADVYGRILAQKLTAATGHKFILEDRPGAASIIGSEAVARARPNGDTLLIISNTHTVNETLYPHKPFKLLTDFVPVAPINSADLVLVTHPSLGVKTPEALIALAKKKPGKLTFASSGFGTPYHMAGELLMQMAGIDLVHVPFKGSSQARIDVIGGQVDMMFDAITTMSGLIRSGKVTGIATTGKTRSPVLPHLPCFNEHAVPGYEAVLWLGLVAPKGTPPAVVNRLNQLITGIDSTPAIKASWERQGATPVVMTPAQFRRFIAGDIAKWAKVIRFAHIHIHA